MRKLGAKVLDKFLEKGPAGVIESLNGQIKSPVVEKLLKSLKGAMLLITQLWEKSFGQIYIQLNKLIKKSFMNMNIRGYIRDLGKNLLVPNAIGVDFSLDSSLGRNRKVYRTTTGRCTQDGKGTGCPDALPARSATVSAMRMGDRTTTPYATMWPVRQSSKIGRGVAYISYVKLVLCVTLPVCNTAKIRSASAMYDHNGMSRDCSGHGLCVWNFQQGNHCQCQPGYKYDNVTQSCCPEGYTKACEGASIRSVDTKGAGNTSMDTSSKQTFLHGFASGANNGGAKGKKHYTAYMPTMAIGEGALDATGIAGKTEQVNAKEKREKRMKQVLSDEAKSGAVNFFLRMMAKKGLKMAARKRALSAQKKAAGASPGSRVKNPEGKCPTPGISMQCMFGENYRGLVTEDPGFRSAGSEMVSTRCQAGNTATACKDLRGCRWQQTAMEANNECLPIEKHRDADYELWKKRCAQLNPGTCASKAAFDEADPKGSGGNCDFRFNSTQKWECVDATEMQCASRKKVLDCDVKIDMAPAGMSSKYDQLCGMAVLGQPPLKTRFCRMGVRHGEKCDKDTDCPQFEEYVSSSGSYTSCGTIDSVVGCQTATQLRCTDLGVTEMALQGV